PAGFSGRIEYDAELFDRTTVVRLAGHLKRLLAAVVEDPARRLSCLPLVEEPERFQLAAEWSDTRVAYELDVPFHERIAAPERRPWSPVSARSPIGSSTGGPTAWRGGSRPWGWGRSRGWGSPPSGRSS